MKIASLNGTASQTDYNGYINNYFIVNDSYNFSGNNSIDVTSVFTLKTFYDINQFDYIVFRDSCKANVITNWSGLSSDEQKELIKYYIYPPSVVQADIDAFYSADEQIVNWVVLADISKQARENRWEATRQKISFNLSQSATLALYEDTKSFKGDFIDANLPNLVLWLTSGTYPPLGIDYTTTGFSSKPYYSASIESMCIDILVNGNY
jgi:hypothetical protein